MLSSDQPYYDILDEPHCTACTHIAVDRRSPPVSSMSTPLLGRQRRNSFPRGPIVTPIADQQQEDNGPTSPSYVFKNRTRALPKLGGSKVCPRCHKPVAVMDDVPGPMASRWHKKCLACAKCKKQMDSSAKVTEGEQGEWLVHCSDCKVGKKGKIVLSSLLTHDIDMSRIIHPNKSSCDDKQLKANLCLLSKYMYMTIDTM